MSKEDDLTTEVSWYYEMMAKNAVKALNKKNIEALYVPDSQKAFDELIKRLPKKSSIGLGDSATLQQIGIIQWLNKNKSDYHIYDPFSLEWADFDSNNWEDFRTARFNMQRKALVADIFLTGVNAITIDGKLISMDGHGNRVAAMAFGPGKIIFVCGINKIVSDRTEAENRIKEYCAPINVKRHYEKHNIKALEDLPCLKTGKCHNCNSKARICRILSVIDGWSPVFHSPNEKQPTVILIGETLGI